MNISDTEMIFRQSQYKQELCDALDKDELFVVYQPQVSATDGKIIGAEALARWAHAELGSISPSKFIPLSEETGTIALIGEKVLRTACEDHRTWIQKGFIPIRLSINLSVKELQDPNYIDRVKTILAETDMDPSYLEFEITETMELYGLEREIEKLHILKELGISIAIDDFGTGYSSLSHLNILPLNTLKIDGSLINDIAHNRDLQTITKSVIDLAHSLNLRVVAEWVEDPKQIHILKKFGCHIFQGYYISPPVQKDALEQMIGAHEHSLLLKSF